jgi:hypothetical protein
MNEKSCAACQNLIFKNVLGASAVQPREDDFAQLFARPCRLSDQGCQIFLGTWNQNRKNVPNQHKMYQVIIKYPECE